MFYRFIRALIAPFVYLHFRPIIEGKEYSDFKGPAIVICNHISMGDPLLLAVVFKRSLHFMAKSELFKNKLLGTLLHWLNAFSVNRNSLDVSSVRNSLDVLKNGHVFAIFPEGTRNRTPQLLPFQKGFAYIAIKANVPVIPVCTKRAGWRRRVLIGEPLLLEGVLEGLDKHERIDAAVEYMQNGLQQVLDRL